MPLPLAEVGNQRLGGARVVDLDGGWCAVGLRGAVKLPNAGVLGRPVVKVAESLAPLRPE